MALTLEQYAAYLDTRDLPWPAPPEVDRPRARPHLARLPKVRAVTWNVYGTLLAIAGGDLVFQHPNDFVMNVALDKTVQEFKMWASMSRKPGQPADYMKIIYEQVLDEQRLAAAGRAAARRSPPTASGRRSSRSCSRRTTSSTPNFYGSLNEFSRKVAYFFHASLQGTCCYPGAAAALRHVAGAGLPQGLLADAQCFTTSSCSAAWRPRSRSSWTSAGPRTCSALSYEVRGRKPSERLFRQSLQQLAEARPSRRIRCCTSARGSSRTSCPPSASGMKTALFAGDRASLQATGGAVQGAAQPARRAA